MQFLIFEWDFGFFSCWITCSVQLSIISPWCHNSIVCGISVSHYLLPLLVCLSPVVLVKVITGIIVIPSWCHADTVHSLSASGVDFIFPRCLACFLLCIAEIMDEIYLIFMATKRKKWSQVCSTPVILHRTAFVNSVSSLALVCIYHPSQFSLNVFSHCILVSVNLLLLILECVEFMQGVNNNECNIEYFLWSLASYHSLIWKWNEFY